MLIRCTLVFIRWYTIVTCISVLLPAYFKKICTKDSQCSKGNETCARQLDGTFSCQQLIQANEIIDASSTEDGINTNMASSKMPRLGMKKSGFGLDVKDEVSAVLGILRISFIVAAIVIIIVILVCLSCCAGCGVLLYVVLKNNYHTRKRR